MSALFSSPTVTKGMMILWVELVGVRHGGLPDCAPTPAGAPVVVTGLRRDHPGRWTSENSAEGDVVDVDGDRGRVQDWGAVGVADVHPATRRHLDAVEHPGPRRVVHRGPAAQDVDGVVQAPQQPRVVEVA